MTPAGRFSIFFGAFPNSPPVQPDYYPGSWVCTSGLSFCVGGLQIDLVVCTCVNPLVSN